MCLICNGEILEGLTIIDADCPNLFHITNLPEGLLELYCFCSNLVDIDKLPESLTILDCMSCHFLKALPSLPPSLQELYCPNTSLTSLPPLPPGLQILSCWESSLNCLPTLPDSLRELGCNRTPLTSLPSLPLRLFGLECSFTNIRILPELPSNLVSLRCVGCRFLTRIPTLPPTLLISDIRYCPWISQNPVFLHNFRLLVVLQRKLKIKLWKRYLNKRFYLKHFPREVSNIIMSFAGNV